MSAQLERCGREWHELEREFQELQETHRIYRQKLEELTALQTLCSSSINKHKTRLKDLKHTLQRHKRHANQEEAELVQQIDINIKERKNIFFDMEAYLPKKNGLYLNLVLGNVNVTLLSNQAKFAYKDEYEKFKLYLTIILLLGAVACQFVLHYRVTDEIFNFLLVWYYCTLTIRESILISNGSSGLLGQIPALPGLTLNVGQENQRLVGVSPLRVHVPVRSDADLAGRADLSEVSQPVFSVFHFSELCPVPAILLPERLPLPAAGSGGEESFGPHCGGIPVLDVAGPHLPPAFPVLWPLLAALQRSHAVRALQPRGVQRMAGVRAGAHVPGPLPRQLPDHTQSRARQAPEEQRQGEAAVSPWTARLQGVCRHPHC
ncbi:transmembrane protein 120B isoform X1 [Molossus molossus]|uniref:transmembrane protein 120B isoform X1 n=1 Tax=Molossus molossus TaxID=27622 RepID=UPI0017467B08|nr:transmembrane protein 120B isoform X1 [Molossus molossus]